MEGSDNVSQTVDERVVQMRFNNQQFESGVKTSMNTLEKLKYSLNFDGVSRNISKSFSSLEQSISVNKIASNLETISDRFSAMGIVGATVLSNLTTSAMEFASKLSGLVINPIVEGGKTRALNIEQAKFKLGGLGVEWDQIKDDIDYGVKDTAYGLDAAATVASQLVASQVELGDSMRTALRGVSGVAAMTSSSYEEIGHIFTTVAGQGRLMGMQLTQLSMRGINAAATLGKYLNKTEAEVRDMVSKGQIDFATFAKAMDDAYGAHAKDANKTFTGAMSNTKAALSRIGAKFATPIYDNLKDIMNALIPVFNDINKALDPVVELFTNGLKKATDYAVKYLGRFGKTTKDTAKKVDDLEEIVKRVWRGDFGNGEERKRQLESLGYSYEEVQKRVNGFSDSVSEANEVTSIIPEIISNVTEAFANVGTQILNVVNGIRNAYQEVFDGSSIDVVGITTSLKTVSEKFKIADETVGKIKNTFKGLFAVIDLFRISVSGTILAFSPLGNVTSSFIDFILSITSAFGEDIASVDEAAKKHSVFYENMKQFVQLLRDDFVTVIPYIWDFILNVASALEPITNLVSSIAKAVAAFFTKAWTPQQEREANLISETMSSLAKALLNIGSAVARVAKPIIEAFFEMFPSFGMNRVLGIAESIEEFTSSLKISDSTADKIRRTFKGLFGALDIVRQVFSAVIRVLFPTSDGLAVLGRGVVSLTGGLGDFIAELAVSLRENDTIYKVLKKVSDFIKVLFGTVKEKSIAIAQLVGDYSGIKLRLPTLDELFAFAEKIKEKLGVIPDFFRKFFSSFSNKNHNSEDSSSFLEKASRLFGKLSETIEDVSPKIAEVFDNLSLVFDKLHTKRLGTIVNIGFFIILITVLKKLAFAISSFFNFSFLKNANGVLIGTRGALTALSKDLQSNQLVKIAKAIAILTGSIVVLSMIDSDKLRKAIIAITILIAELVGSFLLIKKFITTGKDAMGMGLLGVGLLGLAISISVLATALKRLGTLDNEALVKGRACLFSLLGGLVLFSKLLPKEASLIKASAAIVVLSIALTIMAGALKIVSSVKYAIENVVVLAIAIAALCGIAALFSRATPSILKFSAALAVLSVSLIASSVAMVAMAVGLKALSSVKKAGKGLLVLAGAILLLGVAAFACQSILPQMIALSAALIVFALALDLLAPSLIAISQMKNIGESLLAIAGVVAILGLSATLWGGIAGQMILCASAMVIFSAAIAILAPALAILGKLDLGEIGKSLLTLAGALAIFGVAALILGPISPLLLALSVSLLAAGAGFVLLGAGIAVLAVGVALLATSISAIELLLDTLEKSVPRITAIIGELIISFLETLENVIPKIVAIIGRLIVSLLGTVLEYLPTIIDIGVLIIVGILKGLLDHLDEIANVAISIVLTLVNTISDRIEEVVDAGTNLIISFVDGLAESLRDNTPKILSALRNVLSAIIEMIITVIQDLLKMLDIPKLSDEWISDLEDAKESVRETLGVGEEWSYDGGKATVSVHLDVKKPSSEERAKILEDMTPEEMSKRLEILRVYGFGDVVDSTKEYYGKQIGEKTAASAKKEAKKNQITANDLVDEYSGKEAGEKFGNDFQLGLDSSLPDLNSLSSSLFDQDLSGLTGGSDLSFDFSSLYGDGLEGLSANLPTINGLGESFGEEFSNGLGDSEYLVFDASQDLGESVLDGLNIDFSSLGLNSGGSYALGLSDSTSDIFDVSGILTDTATNNLIGADKKYLKSGSSNGTSYAEGIESKKKASLDSGKKLAECGTQGLKEVTPEYRRAGHNAGIGFGNGLYIDSSEEVSQSAESLGLFALNALRTVLDIHSPSTEFRKLGGSSGEGYVEGLDGWLKPASAASAEIGKQCLFVLANSISTAYDILSDDIAIDPTIRPVIDLTNIKEGSDLIKKLLPHGEISTGQIGFYTGIRLPKDLSKLAYSIDRNTSSEQEGLLNTVRELRKDVVSLGDSIKRMQIRMDTGATVGALVDPLDEALGKKQARLRRR